MMNRPTPEDNINKELSRTYFNNAFSASDKAKAESCRTRAKGVSRRTFIYRALFGLAILSLAGMSLFFLRQGKLILNIDIKVEKPNLTVVRNVTNKPGAPARAMKISSPENMPFQNAYTIFDFEGDDEGWEIPSWAMDKPDHIATDVTRIKDISTNGKYSLMISAVFPANAWSAALVEIQQYMDLSGYNIIATDILLPPDAPQGLRAKLILTVGDDWRFVEMARSFKLTPGEWTTVYADISPGSTAWKRVKVDEVFSSDIRKIAVRIESNKPPYSGDIYVDNIRAAVE
ncbi:MAG: hypothetical protein PHQ61_03230 [Candidatus Omnitrophica bacterium]|nr:hypothetical protein [Candidatus Omnitrophota bacterium]